jgi:formylmethanofuran dehydrogenase subunit E
MAAGNSLAQSERKTTLPVRIPQAKIRMKSPNSALFGLSTDGIVEITYAEVLKVHGYCGGGAAYAFRMAQEAFRSLYGDQLPIRQAIQVKTSHHCCQADALAYITGARGNYGAFRSQGDLALLPEEDKKTIFIDKPTGKTVTLHMHFNPHHTFEPLFKKAMQDPKYAPEVHKALNEKIAEYLTLPIEKLFDIVMQ